MTKDGELCNDRGHLGPQEFENVMREQLPLYTQVLQEQLPRHLSADSAAEFPPICWPARLSAAHERRLVSDM